jgi:hypothetical protein
MAPNGCDLRVGPENCKSSRRKVALKYRVSIEKKDVRGDSLLPPGIPGASGRHASPVQTDNQGTKFGSDLWASV